jgi:hypothetical protein
LAEKYEVIMKLSQEEFLNICLELQIINEYQLKNKDYDIYCRWNSGNIEQKSGYYNETWLEFKDTESEPIFIDFNTVLEYFFPNISLWTYFKLSHNLIDRPISKTDTCSKSFNLIEMFNYFNLNYEAITKNLISYEY